VGLKALRRSGSFVEVAWAFLRESAPPVLRSRTPIFSSPLALIFTIIDFGAFSAEARQILAWPPLFSGGPIFAQCSYNPRRGASTNLEAHLGSKLELTMDANGTGATSTGSSGTKDSGSATTSTTAGATGTRYATE
jgi:hypothetical protein